MSSIYDSCKEYMVDMQIGMMENIEPMKAERHDSDEEELRRESAELRDYNDFFDMEDR